MKRFSGPRKTAELSESIQQHLNMYALTASAAGVGVLALAQPSEARIVYTPAHVTIALHRSYKLDPNHDGIADFTILNTSYHNTSTWFYRLYEKAAQGNAVEASISHTFQQELAKALNRGTRIPDHAFSSKPALLATAVFNPGGTFSDGNWVNVSGRYLGLRFKISGRTHYGWARLSVRVHGTSVTGILTGYAYETIPSKSIKAGQTFDILPPTPDSLSPDDLGTDASRANPTRDTPQPISLGMLALGAQGLPLWRRKEWTGTTQQGGKQKSRNIN
jgi:hypothetical protein